MQDNYAIQSFERGIAAQDSGAFQWEIAPVRQLVLRMQLVLFIVDPQYNWWIGSMQVEVPGGRGKPSTIVDKDEGLGKVTYCYNHVICWKICLS